MGWSFKTGSTVLHMYSGPSLKHLETGHNFLAPSGVDTCHFPSDKGHLSNKGQICLAEAEGVSLLEGVGSMGATVVFSTSKSVGGQ